MSTPNEIFSPRDHVVLVTGGGRGIGKVIAATFAAAGADVAVASRTASELEEAVAAVRQHGRRALAVTGDVRVVADADRLVAATVAAFGRLDILINNAGVYRSAPAVEMSEEDWDLMVDVNLKGAFFTARAAARVMLPRGYGRIVNVSSALARVAQNGYAAYGAAKAGVEQITRVLALEWARAGITVNAIAPTTTELPEQIERLRTPEQLARADAKIPLGRFGQPADIAAAALYLASPAAAFVTGQTLLVDGGFSL
jgi:NAD(P)-dependent dehydrogenase (short-subunit alcohol dehydrogenase family)